MKQEAPGWVKALYRNVRFPVQRGDVARFFILFKYGGLYADLDVFPNLEKFPLVPLGLCKMVARSTPKMQRPPEWEIDVVVATAGNQFILEILAGMKRAIAAKSKIAWYKDKPCRFIYRTTGPILVSNVLKSRGYEPHVTVFSMCRPVQFLENHIELDNLGRVWCHHLPRVFKSCDVWSAFSMGKTTADPGGPPPLAMLPVARLPPFPPFPQKQKCRRLRVKTTVAPAAKVDKQPNPSYELPPQFQPGNPIDEGLQPSSEPQQISLPTAKIEQPISSHELRPKTEPIDEGVHPGYEPQRATAHEAFDDMVAVFNTQRRLTAVAATYYLLHGNTQEYLSSLQQ